MSRRPIGGDAGSASDDERVLFLIQVESPPVKPSNRRPSPKKRFCALSSAKPVATRGADLKGPRHGGRWTFCRAELFLSSRSLGGVQIRRGSRAGVKPAPTRRSPTPPVGAGLIPARKRIDDIGKGPELVDVLGFEDRRSRRDDNTQKGTQNRFLLDRRIFWEYNPKS